VRRENMYNNERDRIEKIEKARKDIYDALKSLNDLSNNDRQNLIGEFMRAGLFTTLFMQTNK